MNRQQRKATAKRAERIEKKTNQIATGITATMETLELLPLRKRLSVAYRLIMRTRTKERERSRAALAKTVL